MTRTHSQAEIRPQQSLIRTGDLAQFLGIHVTTLCRWSRMPGVWRDAMPRRGWYSIQRLRLAGLLPPVSERPAQVVCDVG